MAGSMPLAARFRKTKGRLAPALENDVSAIRPKAESRRRYCTRAVLPTLTETVFGALKVPSACLTTTV